jgi:hypothetical protein
VPFHCLEWWTQVSSSMTICESKSSPPVSQRISDNRFPCPFACICQNSWHPTSIDFWIASSLITALHYLYQRIAGTQFICFYVTVTVYQFMKLADVVRNQCSVSATYLLWSVMKCCSSCLSVFTPS